MTFSRPFLLPRSNGYQLANKVTLWLMAVYISSYFGCGLLMKLGVHLVTPRRNIFTTRQLLVPVIRWNPRRHRGTPKKEYLVLASAPVAPRTRCPASMCESRLCNRS